jgi:hypothetical protein
MSSFAEGQVWTMKGASAPDTRIVFGKVDRIGRETIIQVSLINEPFPPPAPGSPSYAGRQCAQRKISKTAISFVRTTIHSNGGVHAGHKTKPRN